ncbi:MAG: type II toxin-antitoxin system RelE/ParE family toxin [Vicinamibacterales bacterium]
MTRALRLDITEQAQQHILAAAAWWSQHRLGAPGAVLEDLDHTLELLRGQPELGTRARRTTLAGVRRVTLSRIRYVLYYRVTGDVLQVLALWHSSRGAGPIL